MEFSVLASGSTDKTARLWDVLAGQSVATLSAVGQGRGDGELPVVAEEKPQKGWSAAVAIILLVVALLILGAWWLLRQNRRARHVESATLPPALAMPCSACGRNLKVKAEWAGKKVKCPQCGRFLRVPEIKAASSGSTSR